VTTTSRRDLECEQALALEVLEHLDRAVYGATVAYRQPESMGGELVNGPNAKLGSGTGVDAGHVDLHFLCSGQNASTLGRDLPSFLSRDVETIRTVPSESVVPFAVECLGTAN
jgi:hypothetical protein